MLSYIHKDVHCTKEMHFQPLKALHCGIWAPLAITGFTLFVCTGKFLITKEVQHRVKEQKLTNEELNRRLLEACSQHQAMMQGTGSLDYFRLNLQQGAPLQQATTTATSVPEPEGFYEADGTWWQQDPDDSKLWWFKKQGQPWGRWMDKSVSWLCHNIWVLFILQ